MRIGKLGSDAWRLRTTRQIILAEGLSAIVVQEDYGRGVCPSSAYHKFVENGSRQYLNDRSDTPSPVLYFAWSVS